MKIKGPGGLSVETKNERQDVAKAVPPGIKISGAKAGQDIVTENHSSDGGIELAELDAGRNIRTTNRPDENLPKA